MAAKTKKINRTTYIYEGNLLGEIKGPYRPGSVWKLEVYTVNKLFDEAWDSNLLTYVQRGKCTPAEDQVFAAISMSQSNAVDSELYTGVPKCVGYTYKTQREAKAAFTRYVASN